MSLTRLLRFAPVRYSVLGPSAESLLVTYRFPGIKARVLSTSTEQSSSVTFKSNVPAPFFHYPDGVRSVYAESSLELNPYTDSGSTVTEKYSVQSRTASATIQTKLRDSLYLERNNAQA